MGIVFIRCGAMVAVVGPCFEGLWLWLLFRVVVWFAGSGLFFVAGFGRLEWLPLRGLSLFLGWFSGVGVLFGISIVCQLFMMMFFDWLALVVALMASFLGLLGGCFGWLVFVFCFASFSGFLSLF